MKRCWPVFLSHRISKPADDRRADETSGLLVNAEPALLTHTECVCMSFSQWVHGNTQSLSEYPCRKVTSPDLLRSDPLCRTEIDLFPPQTYRAQRSGWKETVLTLKYWLVVFRVHDGLKAYIYKKKNTLKSCGIIHFLYSNVIDLCPPQSWPNGQEIIVIRSQFRKTKNINGSMTAECVIHLQNCRRWFFCFRRIFQNYMSAIVYLRRVLLALRYTSMDYT